jgi:hypothetical protein
MRITIYIVRLGWVLIIAGLVAAAVLASRPRARPCSPLTPPDITCRP